MGAGEHAMSPDYHAPFGGSGIHRVLAGCHGSVRLSARVPPAPPSPYQAEGTEAHAELARRIRALLDADVSPDTFTGSIGTAVAYVADIAKHYCFVATEKRVFFPQSIIPREEASGTADVLIYNNRDHTLHLIDYKHGVGEYVEAEENAQLMFYACAAMHTFGLKPRSVVLTIIQPNSPFGEPIREYRPTMVDLFDFARGVRHAIGEAVKMHAPLLAGEHCRFCPAGPVCDERERQAIAVLTDEPHGTIKSWVSELPPPAELDLNRLGTIYTQAPAIRAYLKSVTDYAEARALAGEITVPGCKIVEARGEREWAGHDFAVADALLAAVNGYLAPHGAYESIDNILPRKLIGITAAEKLVIEAATRGTTTVAERRAAIAKAKEAFSALTVKKSSGALTLVPISDPRPPADRTAKQFGTVNLEGLVE